MWIQLNSSVGFTVSSFLPPRLIKGKSHRPPVILTGVAPKVKMQDSERFLGGVGVPWEKGENANDSYLVS